MPNLGLNEALLYVNRRNVSNSVGLFYQVEECFGCSLNEIKPIEEEHDGTTNKYMIGTKHNVRLELRQANSASSMCHFNDLSLNSQAQYQIDIVAASNQSHNATSSGQFECQLKTLDAGECLLCPFAILICFLFAITALEQAYAKFWLKKRSKRSNGGRKMSPEQVDDDGRVDDEGDVHSNNNNSNINDDDDDESTSQSSDQSSGNNQAQTSTRARNQARGAGMGLQAGATTSTKTRTGAYVVVDANEPVVKRRIECLDVFRGLTLASMIFVNYGGAGYAIWEHKPWNGISLADFVFPFFIFSMGASIAISTKSLIKRHNKSFRAIAMKIFSRSIILALLGVCLNSKWINYEQADGLSKLRLTGVLQRFSISYLVIAFMYTIELTLNKWTRAQSLTNVPYASKLIGISFEILTAINYIAIYIYVTFYFDYDSANCPIGYTGPGGQTSGGQYAACTGGAAAWLDRTILGVNHLYNDLEVKQIFKTQVTHDPEGLLGYTTSIVLTLIGLQCGKILIGKRAHKQNLLALSKWILALAFSCSLVVIIPINKRLWSLTFVIVTALVAFIIISALYLLIDIYSCKKAFLLRLLSSAGKNSIFLYVGHSLIFGMLPWWFPLGDQLSHMQLLFRLTWSTLIWLLIAHYMAHKRLFVKI